MRAYFPLRVDDSWNKTRHRSYRREGELLLNIIRDALWPERSIKKCLENWTPIQRVLAEDIPDELRE